MRGGLTQEEIDKLEAELAAATAPFEAAKAKVLADPTNAPAKEELDNVRVTYQKATEALTAALTAEFNEQEEKVAEARKKAEDARKAAEDAARARAAALGKQTFANLPGIPKPPGMPKPPANPHAKGGRRRRSRKTRRYARRTR
jgi:hypothetical protein